MECNNKSQCHLPKVITEDNCAMRVICQTCKHQYIIRKDPFKGVPEKRSYAKIFKKDILQGNDNLFYKYNAQFLHI